MDLLSAPVSIFIFVLTVGTSLYGLYGNRNVIDNLMLHPYSINRGKKYFTILGSGIVHADLNHLLFNMLSFFFFAFTLERITGSLFFGLLYILSLLISDLPSIIKHKNNPDYYSLGASGAISAVIFSYILFDPLTKFYLFFIPIGIPAYIFGVLYLAYCAYAARQTGDHINHDAHFYGALSGLFITILFHKGILSNFIQTISTQLALLI